MLVNPTEKWEIQLNQLDQLEPAKHRNGIITKPPVFLLIAFTVTGRIMVQ